MIGFTQLANLAKWKLLIYIKPNRPCQLSSIGHLRGEKIIITRKGKPVVTLQKLDKTKNKRVGGQFKGKLKIAKDFDILPEDFMKQFE